MLCSKTKSEPADGCPIWSQSCLMEQRQMRLVNLIKFWGFTFSASASRYSIRLLIVCLFLFEDCNTNNLKLTKMSAWGTEGLALQNVGFCPKQRLYILDILVDVHLQNVFLAEELKISLVIGYSSKMTSERLMSSFLIPLVIVLLTLLLGSFIAMSFL